MKYDTNLFLEIIESIPGVIFLRSNSLDGINIRFYTGNTGKLVKIDCTDEYLYDDTAIGYLTQLGLDDLITSLFPTTINSICTENPD